MLKTTIRVLSLATLLVAIFTAALFAGHASAGAMFVVTKTADTAHGTCDSTDCSVREAVIAANAAGGGTIQIPAGTYLIAIPGGGEDASATGDFDITSAITVIGVGPDQTILDGANLDRVIDVRAGGSLNISGLTIQHGKVGHGLVAGLRADGPLVMSNVHVVNNEGDGTDADGATGGVSINHQALITDSIISNNKTTGNSVGGLAARDGSNVTIRNTIIEGNSDTGSFPLGGILLRGQATLDNVIVRNNTADGHEPVGGLFAGKASVVTIMNSQFLNNHTTGDVAVGGIFSMGEMSIWDTTVDGNKTATGTDGVAGILSLPNDAKTNKLTLRRVVVSNNSAVGNNTVGGAAIQTSADLGEVTIDRNSVTDNSTGGLKFFAANPVTLSRVKITNNSAGMSATGGLFVGGASHVTVTDSWIDHNTSAGSAEAGVYVTGGSTADFIRVGITNNSASGASATGGISVYQATGSLTNVTVSGNSAVGNATGGVYVGSGTITLDFTTIDNNTAGNTLGVGGLTSYGTVHISNSIVGHNPGQNSCYQTTGASTGHNIDQGTDCSFTQPTDKQNTNPQLAALGVSGGSFSPTEPIAPNSPAVDAAGSCSLTEDQRIFPRPQGNGCDVGAFEVGSVATKDLKWGALKCANGPTAADALAMIEHAAGVTVATSAGSACPALGASVYVAGWFLHIGWGDFDCDGLVTVLDALAVLRGVADIGYPSAKPCPRVGDTVQVAG